MLKIREKRIASIKDKIIASYNNCEEKPPVKIELKGELISEHCDDDPTKSKYSDEDDKKDIELVKNIALGFIAGNKAKKKEKISVMVKKESGNYYLGNKSYLGSGNLYDALYKLGVPSTEANKLIKEVDKNGIASGVYEVKR
jgi:hypothetical protein